MNTKYYIWNTSTLKYHEHNFDELPKEHLVLLQKGKSLKNIHLFFETIDNFLSRHNTLLDMDKRNDRAEELDNEQKVNHE